MTVVSFADFTPPARFDGLPWTNVRIEESATGIGPWTAIDTFAISPLDLDPSEPASHDYSTENATLTAGFYRWVFIDADGDEAPTSPLQRIGLDPALPTVDDVAALIRTRTTLPGTAGREAGTFTDETRPTAWQVAALIDQAYFYITASLPSDGVPARLGGVARHLIAVYAAILVEQSYFPEQVQNGESGAAVLQTMLESGLTVIGNAANDDQPNSLRFYSIPVTTAIGSSNSVFVIDDSDLLP